MRYFFSLLMVFCLIQCKREPTTLKEKNRTLFSLMPSKVTGITFKNRITSSNSFNFLNYPYIYNGGGVAVGDINNDGFDDIYFSANQHSNKLYLNKGNFKFEDITENAKVTDNFGWTTGVSMIDINHDGFLDIYVCKSGKFDNPKDRRNKLFINNGDATFSEKAQEWGLADTGFSSQAYFIDYDKDEDLDLYLVNHRPDFGNLRSTKAIIQEASDQLYRNDDGFFTNVSKQAGIQNKAWGLSAAVADFNNDSWPDIYVCNDFSEPDFLYINDKKGGFSNQVLTEMDHIAFNSMGSDIADFDNDGLLDLIVLDMSAEDHIRSKTNMPSMSTEAFEAAVAKGNHYQYMFNMLYWNREGISFSEIAQMAGVAKTDWSWAPLLADFDNDGLKDLLVTNGIKKDVGNVDFRNTLERKIQRNEKMNLQSVLDMVPGTPLINYAFKNKGDLTFTKKQKDWGLFQPSFSNGAAYADLDNDGDLDLIINNLDGEAFVYRNNSSQNYIQFKLEGPPKNRFGFGAEVSIYYGTQIQKQVLYANRGYQSSVSPLLHFGLNNSNALVTASIKWSDESTQEWTKIQPNQQVKLSYHSAKKNSSKKTVKDQITRLKEIDPTSLGITYKHHELSFNDYNKQLLLPYKLSQGGPYIAVSDVNGDQLDDFYVGGASGQSGALYLQDNKGAFTKSKQSAFEKDRIYEDMEALFFDFDHDGDKDLYLVSGGNEFEKGSKWYEDRLYENKGNGQFERTKNKLPYWTNAGQNIASADIDNDGDIDLFLGGRHVPGQYPTPPKSTLLLNKNGVFVDITNDQIPDLHDLGMVTDAIFSDYDKDGDQDLLVIGEWMPILLFENENGYFKKKNIESLDNTKGLWFTIASEDVDNDGDEDFFLGNIGLNTKFKADAHHSFEIYGNDFDRSGSFDIVLANEYKNQLVPIRGKQCSSEQTPFIANKFSTYTDFAHASLAEIYGEEALNKAVHHKADLLESVFLENLGDGEFLIQKLPNIFQLSPIRDFQFIDIDKNGVKEIFAVGNLYPVEVETVRFDASKGAVTHYSQNSFETVKNSGFLTRGDTRNMQIMSVKDKQVLMVTRNNDSLQIFEVGRVPLN